MKQLRLTARFLCLGFTVGILLPTIAFLISHHVSLITPQAVRAAAGTATFTGTSQELTGDITAGRLVDQANTAYYIDPAASGNSLVTAGTASVSGNLVLNAGSTIGTTNMQPLTIGSATTGLTTVTSGGKLQLQAGGTGTGSTGTGGIYFLDSSGTSRGRFDTTIGSGIDQNFGSGSDGAITVTATKNINTDIIGASRLTYADGIAYRVIAPSSSSTSVSRYSGSDTISNGIAANDEVLLINLQGTNGDSADVGNYEFMKVSSVTVSTITFPKAITKTFAGTTASNQKVIVQRVPQYTNVTLSSSGSLTASVWEALATTPTGAAGYLTSIVAFRATGTVTVGSGTSITANSLGYRGGSTYADSGSYPRNGAGGEAFCGAGGTPSGGAGAGGAAYMDGTGGVGYCGGGGNSANGSASLGGAGGASWSGGGAGYGTFGGGGKNNTNATNGANGGTNSSGNGGTAGGGGGGTYGTATLSSLFLGSGGGKGSADYRFNSNSGNGGKGGGIIFIAGNTVTVSGSITSNGAAGENYSSGISISGGGGGGSGGSVLIVSGASTLGTSLVSSSGGTGGAGTDNSNPTIYFGGDGGSGRIRVEYTGSLSGTTSPAASTATSISSGVQSSLYTNYGTLYIGSTNTGSSDLAEYYMSGDKTIEAGDVVTISQKSKVKSQNGEDVDTKGVLMKADKPYDAKLIGIISTNPGVLMGSIDGENKEDKRMLALAGRVPVKIDPDSPPIETGDFLTSSSKPGLAEKATKPGYVVGRALESWQPGGADRIEAFLQLTYYLGDIDPWGNFRTLEVDTLKVNKTLEVGGVNVLDEINNLKKRLEILENRP